MKYNLDDIEKIEGEMLSPKIVADILEVNVKTLRNAVYNSQQDLGFPIIKIGKRFKIPKTPFLNYIKGNSNKIA